MTGRGAPWPVAPGLGSRGAGCSTGRQRSLSWLGAAPGTAAYLLLVAVGDVLLLRADEPTRRRLLRSSSTNLVNLRAGRWQVLATSALVVEPPAIGSLAVAAGVLGGAERWLGGRRTAALFALGHVGASLLVAGLLERGELPGVPARAVRGEVDVGLSYGVLAALGAMARRAGAPGLAGLGMLTVPALLRQRTPTAWGHLSAGLLGALAGGGASSSSAHRSGGSMRS